MESAAPELNKFDPSYPKAKYRMVTDGGDIKSPAYEKIGMKDGQATRIVEFYPYVSVTVKSLKEEKQLGPEWVDTPANLKG